MFSWPTLYNCVIENTNSFTRDLREEKEKQRNEMKSNKTTSKHNYFIGVKNISNYAKQRKITKIIQEEDYK